MSNENKVSNEVKNETVATANPAETVKKLGDNEFVECEDREEDAGKFFRKVLHDSNFDKAEKITSKPTNPVRKGEIVVVEDDCSGNFKDFKKKLFEGKEILAPVGLEKVSFRVEGFVARDGSAKDKMSLCAKQFVVTLRINGRWMTLPRYLATVNGGLFALPACQTARAAKEFATVLHMFWIEKRTPEQVKEVFKGWHKKPESK